MNVFEVVHHHGETFGFDFRCSWRPSAPSLVFEIRIDGGLERFRLRRFRRHTAIPSGVNQFVPKALGFFAIRRAERLSVQHPVHSECGPVLLAAFIEGGHCSTTRYRTWT